MCRRKGVRRGTTRGGCPPALESREFASGQEPLEQQSAAVISRDRKAVLGTERKARVQALRRERYRNYSKTRESGSNARYECPRTTDGLTLNHIAFLRNQASLVLVRTMHFPNRSKEKQQSTGFPAGTCGSAGAKQAYALAMLIGTRYFSTDEAVGLGVTAIDINAGVLNEGYRRGNYNRHIRRVNPVLQQTNRNALCPYQSNLLGTFRRRGGSVRSTLSIWSAVPPRSHREVVWVGQPGTLAYLREVPCSKTAREQA
jgi:hypothetical protein